MAGRCEPQAARLGVDHDRHHRDQLLGPAGGRHHQVELLHRLGRVAVLPQEHPQQVLDLEGGDRRLDAVPGHVADDDGQAGRRDRVHVVEVPGHEAFARLVDPADLEPLDLGQILGRQPGRPAARRFQLLLERPFRFADDERPLFGQVGLVQEPGPVAEGDPDRDDDQHEG